MADVTIFDIAPEPVVMPDVAVVADADVDAEKKRSSPVDPVEEPEKKRHKKGGSSSSSSSTSTGDSVTPVSGGEDEKKKRKSSAATTEPKKKKKQQKKKEEGVSDEKEASTETTKRKHGPGYSLLKNEHEKIHRTLASLKKRGEERESSDPTIYGMLYDQLIKFQTKVAELFESEFGKYIKQ